LLGCGRSREVHNRSEGFVSDRLQEKRGQQRGDAGRDHGSFLTEIIL
jgi:hypothetical protein